MIGKKWVIVLGMAVFFAIAVGACSPATPAATEPIQAVPAPEEATETSVPAPMIEPAVAVDDQDASAGTVTVREVTSSGPGWMVIHATTAEGVPGPILGVSPVGEGTTSDVSVEIDLAGATEQLFAMLHVDAGEAGSFEFPDGADAPARAGDQIVNVPFQVTLPAMAISDVTLELADSALGTILVDGRGFVLYIFTVDEQGESACYDACAQNWPPLIVEGEPIVGEGLDADLVGSVTREDGSLQLTYGGWPLYYFIQNTNPGEVKGQGVNDVWFVLGADGNAVVGGDDLPDY